MTVVMNLNTLVSNLEITKHQQNIFNTLKSLKNGKQHGSGKYTWASGGTYVGEYNNNKMHGFGTFIRDNVGKYVGEFKNGVFHGNGTYTFLNGDVQNGPWENGKPLE